MRELTDMRVLVVDDNLANRELIEQILKQSRYTAVRSTPDSAIVEQLCRSWQPDLVLLDLHMPGLTGYDVMAAIRDLIAEPENLPVLVLTADGTLDARHRALSLGARDFVAKPIDRLELLLRVRNLLQVRSLQQRLQHQNASLDEAVRERTVELQQARLESLAMLAWVAEYHDRDTHAHTQRVGITSAEIARALELPDEFVATIRDAAPLHDIGKVGIPKRILLKPGKLTPAERTEMMQHVEIGARILAPASSPALRMAAEIARTHHEHWDGRGYLGGLVGEEIPLSGRIAAVADVFDALTHNRPYKAAWDVEPAVAEISSQAGRQFDATVVSAFRSLDPGRLLDPPELSQATERSSQRRNRLAAA
jgi:putative two-component system response regulator